MSLNEARPFRVLGLQQVAVGGSRREALRALWCDLLGIEQVSEFESAAENVREDVLRLGAGPLAVEIDLMEPIDADASPRVDHPALNHVGLWVDDLHAAVQWLSARGMRFTPGGIRTGASGYEVCFVHPRADDTHPASGEGVLIELVQAPPAVIAAFDALAAP